MGILSTGADDEFPDTVPRIGISVGILGGKALIMMIVAADDDVSASGVEHLPQRFHLRIIAVLRAGTKQGLMEIRQGAGSGMLC